MIDFSAPLQGMMAAGKSLEQTAVKIASAGASPQGDSVDLSAEMIALIEAKDSVAANVNVAKTMDQVTRSVINMLG